MTVTWEDPGDVRQPLFFSLRQRRATVEVRRCGRCNTDRCKPWAAVRSEQLLSWQLASCPGSGGWPKPLLG